MLNHVSIRDLSSGWSFDKVVKVQVGVSLKAVFFAEGGHSGAIPGAMDARTDDRTCDSPGAIVRFGWSLRGPGPARSASTIKNGQKI